MTEASGRKLIVVYHADCIDGSASAWAVVKAWQREDGENVSFIPYAHFNKASAEEKIKEETLYAGSVLYFVDVAPDKPLLDLLLTERSLDSIRIYDHHKSAADALKGYTKPADANLRTSLDIMIKPEKTSAAGMIWARMPLDEDAPAVLDAIDKMDGDAKGLVTREDFAAAALIDSKDNSTIAKAFDTLRGLAKDSFNEMAQKGAPILSDQENRIQKLLSSVSYAKVQLLPDTDAVSVPIVNGNVQHFGRMISEKMVELGKKSGSGVMFAWAMNKNGTVSMSVRSDGTPDCNDVVNHLCKTMGVTGGGHAGAGAVHFASLFEFGKNMPFENQPAPAPAQFQAPKNYPNQSIH